MRKKTNKPIKWVLRAMAMSALKKLFVRSPMFQILKKYNRREKVVKNKDGSLSKAKRWEYQCNHCKNWFPEKVKGKATVNVDHIEPAVNPHTGWVDFNTWIEREFVGVEAYDSTKISEKQFYEVISKKLQILCIECHNIKSAEENIIRKNLQKDLKQTRLSKSRKETKDEAIRPRNRRNSSKRKTTPRSKKNT